MSKPRPKLSVVIVAYNMARELPRTLYSLSAQMQRAIDADDYEVIVIDNGSTRAFDEAGCRALIPGLRIERMAAASVSPVAAINAGLALARGEVIGVWIDGARLASPGLLSLALTAARLHTWPVIGTVAFHLGPEVQMTSVLKGYNQHTEDRLLAESKWQENGYRLFDISVFAGSSSRGWHGLPNETNALFMRAAHWRKLGGYDVGFQTPGGGLANLDMWKRACEDPDSRVILLLGEATFHQVHGGVATNSPNPPRQAFDAEYRRLRGGAFAAPTVSFVHHGNLNDHAQANFARTHQRSRL